MCRRCGKNYCLYMELTGNYNRYNNSPYAGCFRLGAKETVRWSFLDAMGKDEYTCIECVLQDFSGENIPLYLLDLRDIKRHLFPESDSRIYHEDEYGRRYHYDQRCSKCFGGVMFYLETAKILLNTTDFNQPDKLYSGLHDEEKVEELENLIKKIALQIKGDDNYVCGMCKNYGFFGPITFNKVEKLELWGLSS